eukprot:TRINITY_DN4896_c0_g1_i3.p1 TRINITY_DN4896_c0_g1~~TRINITY_DN4896_c0_g1_i3.p1  ORF type:complete len:886 (+),score=155.27 TRINITY_DN4896_c0_g1_i3:84-2741(+)
MSNEAREILAHSAKESAVAHTGFIERSFYAESQSWEKILNSRVLRIFMSSTFRDMQQERDIFFQLGENRLREFALKRKVMLVFIDLRWGLTAETSSDGKVVISCLDSIKHCPYLLCTLGARYGWIPDRNKPNEWHPSTDEAYPFLTEIPGLSVTDYEITYAALCEKPIARRAFFFERDLDYALKNMARTPTESVLFQPCDELDGQRQDLLKEKIRQSFPVKVYNGPHHLCEMVIDVLEQAMSIDLPEIKSEDLEEVAHEQLMRHRLIGFAGREDLLENLCMEVHHQLHMTEPKPAVVGAKSGIGKSSIMAALISKVEKSFPAAIIIYHFTGCTSASVFVESIIIRILTKLWARKCISHEPTSEIANEAIKGGMSGVLDILLPERPNIVILIDAVNQLADSRMYPHVHLLNWLPKVLPENVAVIFSTTDDHITYQKSTDFGFNIHPVDTLRPSEMKLAITSYLSRYHKSLRDDQIDLILSNGDVTGHPLYLRLLLEEIRVFGRYELVDQEIYKLIQSPDVVDLFGIVISRWEDKYGESIVRISMTVLCLSRIGLNDGELENYIFTRLDSAIQSSTSFRWKAFMFTLQEVLFVRNGRFCYFHNLLRISATQRYLSDCEVEQKEIACYAKWLISRGHEESGDVDAIAEVCHALLSAKLFPELYNFLKDGKVAHSMLTGPYRYEFTNCWSALSTSGYDQRGCYEDLIKDSSTAAIELIDYFREMEENDFLIKVLKHRISHSSSDEMLCKEYSTLGRVLQQSGNYEEATTVLQKSLEIAIRLYDENDPFVGECCRILGTVEALLARYETSKELLFRALSIKKLAYGEQHQEVAGVYNDIANLLDELGETQEALEYYKKSAEVRIKVFGENHPRVADSYNNMANVYDDQRK